MKTKLFNIHVLNQENKFLISITVLAFHKDSVSSIRISILNTCVLFIMFFSVLKLKSDLSNKILIGNQLSFKPINSRIRNSFFVIRILIRLSNQMPSSVLGYIRFQQPHDNKKLCFSATLLD